MPAGHPSTTTPSAGPWDSPHVVIVNKVPKVDREIYYDQTGAVESLSMSINNEDNNF